MILNGYAVLDAFLSGLRLLLGLLVLVLALAAWRRWGRYTSPEERTALEDRAYLLFLLAGVLLVVDVASWPLLYLLLQSYVPQWPGVMCIYGVTQVGTGSVGLSRFLPGLLKLLQLTKPVLVFLSGAWLGLALLNGRTRTGALTGRLLVVLVLLGVVAVADASAETAYLVLPKKEETLSVGCCTSSYDAASATQRYTPRALFGGRYDAWLGRAYYAVNLLLIGGLAVCTWRGAGERRLLGGPALLLPGVGLAVVVSGLFLVEVAAPVLLHKPGHHCAYDLLPVVPQSLPAIVLFVAASFAVGWAGVLRWAGACTETRAALPGAVRTLLRVALFGYVCSLVLLSVGLALAAAGAQPSPGIHVFLF